MLRKILLSGMLSACVLGYGLTDTATVEASTVSHTNRSQIIYQQQRYLDQELQVAHQPEPINVGYIIVGDDATLLDDKTMGYLRRMLQVKFPGHRYPPKRMESSEGLFEPGRKNYSDQYILTEAHDVLMQEFELLENADRETLKHISVTSSDKREKSKLPEGKSTTTVSIDSAINTDNRLLLSDQLAQLSKEDYVRMARQANADGANYDYLLIFNIHAINRQAKDKGVSNAQWYDICLSVKAIDVQSGTYIDRGEYLKRGYTGSMRSLFPLFPPLPFSVPVAWRRAMRRAIIDSMIECFDHLPIGKYSLCDNPYCERRQDELRTEAVLGKVSRHCTQHCHDTTNCSNHVVDYEKDADLPATYVNHRSKVD